MKKIFTLVFTLMSGYLAQAQTPLLAEHFDYSAGDSITNHGWTAHSGIGTNPIQVTNGGLSWTQTKYMGSGVGNAAAVSNTGSDENHPLTQSVDSGSVYVSLLVRVNGEVSTAPSPSNVGYFFHLGEYSDITNPDYSSVSSAFRARLFTLAGSTPDKFKFGFAFNASSITSGHETGDLDTGVTYLVVVKYTFVPGATDNDSVSLYVFADGDDISSEPAVPAIGPLGRSITSVGDLSVVQLVSLRQFSSRQNIIVDGIIAQQSWNLLAPVAAPELSAFDLLSPPDQTSVTVRSMQTDEVSISWTSSSLSGNGTPVSYEWMAIAPGGDFNTPAVSLPSNLMGSDTTLNIALGTIDALLASLGVNPGDSVELQWTVTANADTLSRRANQTWRVTVKREMTGNASSIEANSALTLMPNPAADVVRIRVSDLINGNFNVSLTDQLGRTLISKTHDVSNTLDLDLSDLSNGIYLIQLESNGQRFTQRLMVQH